MQKIIYDSPKYITRNMRELINKAGVKSFDVGKTSIIFCNDVKSTINNIRDYMEKHYPSKYFHYDIKNQTLHIKETSVGYPEKVRFDRRDDPDRYFYGSIRIKFESVDTALQYATKPRAAYVNNYSFENSTHSKDFKKLMHQSMNHEAKTHMSYIMKEYG